MKLETKTVTPDFNNMDSLAKLNAEAFPNEERMEIPEMLELIGKHRLEVSAVYDDGVFIGFYALHIRKPLAYIFFIAIDKTKRSRGYGSKIIAEMTEQYEDCQIVLDLEAADIKAENNEQRVKRKQFYLRNGFHETGYFLNFNEIPMEIICNKGELNAEKFQNLLDNMQIRNTPMRIFKNKSCL